MSRCAQHVIYVCMCACVSVYLDYVLCSQVHILCQLIPKKCIYLPNLNILSHINLGFLCFCVCVVCTSIYYKINLNSICFLIIMSKFQENLLQSCLTEWIFFNIQICFSCNINKISRRSLNPKKTVKTHLFLNLKNIVLMN